MGGQSLLAGGGSGHGGGATGIHLVVFRIEGETLPIRVTGEIPDLSVLTLPTEVPVHPGEDQIPADRIGGQPLRRILFHAIDDGFAQDPRILLVAGQNLFGNLRFIFRAGECHQSEKYK